MADNLQLSQLTPGEIESLTTAGRIVNGELLPTPEVVQQSAQPARTQLDPKLIPEAPAEVQARLKAAQTLQSSFVHTDLTGKVKKVSDDGGKGAVTKAAEVNPDWAGKPVEEPVDFIDRMAFLASVLGAERFYKEYSILGGNLTVKFQTLTEKESEACGTQVWADEKIDGRTAAGQEGAMFRTLRLRDYQFVASLKSFRKGDDVAIAFDPFGKTSPEPHVGPIRVRLEEFSEATPAPLAFGLRAVYSRFERLIQRLTVEMDNPSFWSPDAAA